MANSPAASWRGSDVLAIIDVNASLPAALDPAALRDREALAEMDAIEATAWIGARLAEALDFAHQRGVLHRDIKPANILVSPYGRPMLADFNISSQQVEEEGSEMFGGTIAYMAPEHLDAFNPADETTEAAVTAQADIYSLGMVLDELLHGRHPQVTLDPNAGMVDRLRSLADQRRQQPPHAVASRCARCPQDAGANHLPLHGRCTRTTASTPAPSSPNNSKAAGNCGRPSGHSRRRPASCPGSWPGRSCGSCCWCCCRQIVASVINISYNASQIVGQLTAPQQQLFMQLVTIYNAAMYPVALATLRLGVLSRCGERWREMHAHSTARAGPGGCRAETGAAAAAVGRRADGGRLAARRRARSRRSFPPAPKCSRRTSGCTSSPRSRSRA